MNFTSPLEVMEVKTKTGVVGGHHTQISKGQAMPCAFPWRLLKGPKPFFLDLLGSQGLFLNSGGPGSSDLLLGRVHWPQVLILALLLPRPHAMRAVLCSLTTLVY